MGKLFIFLIILVLVVGGIAMARKTLGPSNTETEQHTESLPGLPTSAGSSTTTSNSTSTRTTAKNTAPRSQVSTTKEQLPEEEEQQVYTLRSQLGNEILVARPLQGQKISKSPLVASGSAPSEWFKDGQFTATLIGANGELLAEVPAYAQSEITPNSLVRFKATLPYTKVDDNPRATLILKADGKANLSKKTQVEIVVNLM
ncbi:MAG TPA: hypothetical protein VGE63_00135 [Candidatus Paceibacterota bacterium]